MNEQEMKKVLQNAVDRRLSGLKENPFLAQRIIASEKGEQPVVKKKISVSLVFVIALMILTLSAAYALVQSNIASKLYGEETVPQDVIEHIQLPDQNVSSGLGQLSVDEVLFDGSSLHTSFTIANPTEEALLYTVDGLWLNDSPLTRSTLITEGAGSSGLLLGGTVEGTPLPVSLSVYNESDAVYQYDKEGRYLGRASLPAEGTATFKIAVAVWRPVHQPKMIDYSDYEGKNITDTLNCLVTDAKGYADLELFRPEKYDLNTSAAQYSSEVYAQAFEELGWAELADRIELELEVDLDESRLAGVAPVQTEYSFDNVKVSISRFDLSHAGGKMEGWVYGDSDTVKSFMGNGLFLADVEGERVLNNGCIWDEYSQEAGGVHFGFEFFPVTGELPTRVHLAPMVTYDVRWDEATPAYDPLAEKPETVIDGFQLDLSRSILMELTANK